MTAGPRRLLLLPLLLLLPIPIGAPGPRRAHADEWTDARNAFRRSQRAEEWQARRDGFMALLDYDGAEAVDEILRAVLREDNAAVVWEGIKTMALYESAEAVAALTAEARRARGDRQVYALVALAEHPGEAGREVFFEMLGERDTRLVCQGALALGRKQVREALPALLELLGHREWQVRAAAARALRLMAGPLPEKEPGREDEPPPPPLPRWLDPAQVLPPLVKALEEGEGRDRADALEALERISLRDFGYDLAAWKALTAGEDPAAIRARPAPLPYVFGMPVFGRRVVLVIDHSLYVDDPHPFQDRDRLKEVCEVPGAMPVLWVKIKTVQHFFAAHAKRLIQDLPSRDAKFEVIAAGFKAEPVFGRLNPANAGNKRRAIEEVENFTIEYACNTYEAILLALDISGSKDSVAWSLGPDEIVFMTCSNPSGDLKDPEVVGPALGFKARLRMVPIHTVGVGNHPFAMMKVISAQSGGRYLDLSR